MLYVSKMNKMCLNYENKVKTLIVNIPPITTKRTTTHLKLFNTHTHTITTYDIGNTGSHFGQAQTCGRVLRLIGSQHTLS